MLDQATNSWYSVAKDLRRSSCSFGMLVTIQDSHFDEHDQPTEGDTSPQ